MRTKITLIIVVFVAMLALTSTVFADKPVCVNENTTMNSGFCGDKFDSDRNGIPDAGVQVTGKYTSVYAYDVNNWYWDLGDGRIQGTVGSLAELDQETLTVCNYQVQYKADFGNDPYMNSGWISNNINCSGYDDNGSYNFLIVHETDPRYTGNPDWAEWGTWEYIVYTVSGSGNLVKKPISPETP